MLIDVSQIKNNLGKTEEIELEKNLSDSLNWQGDEVIFSQPVMLKAVAEGYEDGIIHLQGELSTEISVCCSRCLKPFQYPIRTDFEGEFLQMGKASSETEEGEVPRQFYSGDFLQLEGLVKENIYLSLPMKFLCIQECKGLCPHCGIRFEVEECICDQEQVDPRFEILKQLLEEKNRKGGS